MSELQLHTSCSKWINFKNMMGKKDKFKLKQTYI